MNRTFLATILLAVFLGGCSTPETKPGNAPETNPQGGEPRQALDKNAMANAEPSFAARLKALDERVTDAYLRMRKAVESQGLPPPILHADGGIEQIPFTVRNLKPDWDSGSFPLFYVAGTELPEPFRSISAEGKARTPDAVAEVLKRNGITKSSPLPRLFMGFTALHVAADAGNVAAVKVLLEQGCGEVDEVNEFGDTPLHVACTQGHWDAVATLMAADQKKNTIHMRNQLGLTPLGMCALANRPAGIKPLLDAGAKLTQESSAGIKDWRQSCELLVAARRGHGLFVQKLVGAMDIPEGLTHEAQRFLSESGSKE